MATQNKRVVGYIFPPDHDKLREFMEQYGCTESKAIALIMQSFFSGTPVSTATSRVQEAINTPTSTAIATPDTSALEAKLTKQMDERIAELEKRLDKRVEDAIAHRSESLGEYAA